MKSLPAQNPHALPVLCLIAVLNGCASTPAPQIAVSGAPTSVAGLAGVWVGDYRLSDGSRHGVVTFDLLPGDSVATGSVIMQRASLNTMDPLAARRDSPGSTSADLTVKFVQVAGGTLRGELDPYTDPDCACPVLTVFEGRHKGDRIEGTFTIRNTINGERRVGDWSVTRQAR